MTPRGGRRGRILDHREVTEDHRHTNAARVVSRTIAPGTARCTCAGSYARHREVAGGESRRRHRERRDERRSKPILDAKASSTRKVHDDPAIPIVARRARARERPSPQGDECSTRTRSQGESGSPASFCIARCEGPKANAIAAAPRFRRGSSPRASKGARRRCAKANVARRRKLRAPQGERSDRCGRAEPVRQRPDHREVNGASANRARRPRGGHRFRSDAEAVITKGGEHG